MTDDCFTRAALKPGKCGRKAESSSAAADSTTEVGMSLSVSIDEGNGCKGQDGKDGNSAVSLTVSQEEAEVLNK